MLIDTEVQEIVHKKIKRYEAKCWKHGIDPEDLRQNIYLHLVDANYCPNLGGKDAYINQVFYNSLRRSIHQEKNKFISIGQEKTKKIQEIHAEIAKSQAELKNINLTELCKKFNISRLLLLEYIDYKRTTIINTSEKFYDIDDKVNYSTQINEILDCLDDDERIIIESQLGNRNDVEIAKHLNMTYFQVRCKKNKILEKLRKIYA